MVTASATVGRDAHRYVVDRAWGQGPRGVRELGVAQGVTGDSHDRVYVFQRAPVACVIVLDRDGTMLDRWGEGAFGTPHGISTTARDELLLTDLAKHLVTRWTTDGRLLQTLGREDVAGDWGEPFNLPTKAVEAPDGEIYVADGYGNRHVHRFDADGRLIESWGGAGAALGEFALPHDVVVDGDRVLVCDRENRRVQRFDRDGRPRAEWAGWQNPMQLFVRDGVMYVAHGAAEISVRRPDGALLARWPYESAVVADVDKWPHSIWADSGGDVYVGEIFGTGGLQKYVCRR